jgi:hypothetical protein
MNLSEDEVRLVPRPLYGIPGSGLHWFITFHNHYTEVLQMSSSRADPCLLYKHINTVPCGVILQVDDSLGYGPDCFQEEEEESKRFLCKPRDITTENHTVFNGVEIRRDGQNIILSQTEKLKAFSVPKTDDEAVSVRAAVQYVANCTRPDLSSPS